MERVVAVKKLGKILGKSLGYRVDPKAPTSEEREEANQRLTALRAARHQAEMAMNERRRAILEADRELKELTAAYQEVRDREKKTLSILHHFKITVGTTSAMFFHVKAQGDSWEEVIDKLTQKPAAAAKDETLSLGYLGPLP